MAVHHGYQTKLVRLVALLVLACLAAGLVRRVTVSLHPTSLSSPPPRPNFWATHPDPTQPNLNPSSSAPYLDRIHGRWATVRASLGLPPVPREAASLPPDASPAIRLDKRASRFDLSRQRRADRTRQLPRLHFAPEG